MYECGGTIVDEFEEWKVGIVGNKTNKFHWNKTLICILYVS